jgi:hypothetical protein
MRVARLLALVCAVLSAGCFSSDSIINVQADGTGTITNTILLKTSTMEMLNTFGSVAAGDDKDKKDELAAAAKDPFGETRMRAAASEMGQGVTFQSLQPLKKEGWEGVKVVYAFKDISKVKFNMRSDSAVAMSESAPEVMTFKFAPASALAPAKLTIVMPLEKALKDAKRGSASKPATMDDSAMGKALLEQFKTMFDGLRASVVVEVAGPIVKTNADHVAGSSITLLALDFGQLMNSGADFETFGAITDGTMPLAEAREKLKNTKGLVMSLQPEVNVEFGAK